MEEEKGETRGGKRITDFNTGFVRCVFGALTSTKILPEPTRSAATHAWMEANEPGFKSLLPHKSIVLSSSSSLWKK